MPIILDFAGKTFDGKHKQIYFFLLDLNDWLGQPFDLQFGENTYSHWTFTEEEIASYPPNSSKRRFCEWFIEQIRQQDLVKKIF